MKSPQSSLIIATYGPEDHVQGHGDVEVKRIVVGHTGHEEHEHEEHVVPETDVPALRPELLRHHEALERHKRELGEGDQVARAGVMSECDGDGLEGKFDDKTDRTHLTISSRKMTLEQQPKNTPQIPRNGLIFNDIGI